MDGDRTGDATFPAFRLLAGAAIKVKATFVKGATTNLR